MKQLRLVQRQPALAAALEYAAVQRPSVRIQVVEGLEQVGVAGHVEHRLKRRAPGVALRLFAALFSPEDARAGVHLARYLHIPPRSEYGACARVRVEQREVGGRESKLALGVRQILRAVQEEGELRLRRRLVFSPHRKQAELDAAVYAGEDFFTILEVVQADERARFHEVAEEEFGGVVGGYAGGDDDSRRPVRRDDGAGGFGEYGIGVDVAASGEREAPAAAREAAR